MFSTRENTRVIHFDSIILIAIVFFGLLIFNNSGKSSTGSDRKPVPAYMFAVGNSTASGSYFRLQVFQKTWILNKDNFNLLAFNRNPLSESKKTGIKVSHLIALCQSSHKIPQFILLYHIFPPENDEPPYLS